MKSAALCLVALVAAVPPTLAVDKDKVAYVGGTLDNIKEKSEGRIETTGQAFMWHEEKTGRTVSIPYSTFVEIEYGSRAGRRITTPIQTGTVSRIKKTAHHYVTITYKDLRNREQVVVFEFGKDIVDHELGIIQGRSHKDVVRLDDPPKAEGQK